MTDHDDFDYETPAERKRRQDAESAAALARELSWVEADEEPEPESLGFARQVLSSKWLAETIRNAQHQAFERAQFLLSNQILLMTTNAVNNPYKDESGISGVKDNDRP